MTMDAGTLALVRELRELDRRIERAQRDRRYADGALRRYRKDRKELTERYPHAVEAAAEVAKGGVR
mgnify:CR=1 FL=1